MQALRLGQVSVRQYYGSEQNSNIIQRSVRFGDTPSQSALSFTPILPTDALAWTDAQTMDELQKRIGAKKLEKILADKGNTPMPIDTLHPTPNRLWRPAIMECNQRLVGTYWNLVKYALTCPEDAIQLKPIWGNPGGSFYGPAHWRLNPEFNDPALIQRGFKTTESQLTLFTNLMHALGKEVLVDSLVHMDKFGEDVFINPKHFEWISFSNPRHMGYLPLHPKIAEAKIVQFVKANGFAPGYEGPLNFNAQNLFSLKTPESLRSQILFGPVPSENNPNEFDVKLKARELRRYQLMQYVYGQDKQTKTSFAPHYAVYDPPYGPVKLTLDPNNADWPVGHVDGVDDGAVTGALTRFRQHAFKENGTRNPDLGDETAQNAYAQVIAPQLLRIGADGIRADLGHQQIHRHKNQNIVATPFFQTLVTVARKKNSNFRHFSEILYRPGPPVDPRQDADEQGVDGALGYLHFLPIGKTDYFWDLPRILSETRHRSHRQSATVYTMDEDKRGHKPELSITPARIVKTFTHYFLGDRHPSFFPMGLELRDDQPKDPNAYAHPYLISKCAPYVWGKNNAFFKAFSEIRRQWVALKPDLTKQQYHWINSPDGKIGAWGFLKPNLLFVTNSDIYNQIRSDVDIDNPFATQSATLAPLSIIAPEDLTSDSATTPKLLRTATIHGKKIHLTNLTPGECRIYRVIPNPA